MNTLSRLAATAGVLAVLVLALFVWPTPYRYFPYNSGGPTAASTTIRVNRFTGATSILTPRGWATMGPDQQVLRY